jgi:Leucine-rich repeat (LRR) protein
MPSKVPTKSPTKQPTKAPIIVFGSRSTDIVMYINNVSLSNKTISLSGNTPLDLALKQLVTSNNSTEVQLSTCLEADKRRLTQRFAYLSFMFSAGKVNVSSWYDKPNECQWVGVDCQNTSAVKGLVLRGKRLSGTIPDDVGLLTGLTVFNVGITNLVGSLPSSIGLWTSLTKFDAFINKLVGSVPSSIGSWTNLTEFTVAFNTFTGTVPREVSKWTSLRYALFYDNNFDRNR